MSEHQSQPQPDETEQSADHEALLLYQKLRSLRWSDGFEGPFAECFCALVCATERGRTVRAVVEIMPQHEEKFQLIDVLNAMSNLGLQAQKQSFSPSAVFDAPALLIPKRMFAAAHPLVILSIETIEGAQIATIYDSATREIRKADLNTSAELNNSVLYSFKKWQREKEENLTLLRAGAGFGWFRALAVRFYKLFAQILCLSFVINILGLATPLFIMLVYDRVIAARVTEAFPYLIGGVLVAIFCEWILRTIRSQRLAWIAARIDNIVGNLTFSKLTRLSAQTSDNVSVTAQLLRLRSFESLRDFFNSIAFVSVMELPFVLIYLTVIFALGGMLAVVPVACVGGYILLFILMRKKIGVEIRRTARTGAASQRFLLETVAKTPDIQTAGLSNKWANKYAALSKREYIAFTRLIIAGNTAETLAHGITLTGGIATLGLGALLSFSGSLSAGALIACLIMTWRTLTPFHNFCAVIQRFEQIRNSISQIDSLMDVAGEEESRATGASLKSLRGGVTFERVGLRLGDSQKPVFVDLTFSSEPGEVIGFTGHSGSGKSLILKLVQGIYPTSYGAVRIDGFDIRQLNSAHLRRMISYIPQKPQLFSGTIAENVRLVRPEATNDDIWHALEKAGASEEVKNLADGLSTNVTEDRRMSVDLLTQISMARAYLLDGRIFLIDELPNTLMMGESGIRLKSLIRERENKRTVLLSTQNQDILDLCDRVFEVSPYGLKLISSLGQPLPAQTVMEQVA